MRRYQPCGADLRRFVGAHLGEQSSLGFAAPNLYTLPVAALHDVRAGNDGQYLAKSGWDWATGLGSLDAGRVAAIMAPSTQPERRRAASP